MTLETLRKVQDSMGAGWLVPPLKYGQAVYMRPANIVFEVAHDRGWRHLLSVEGDGLRVQDVAERMLP